MPTPINAPVNAPVAAAKPKSATPAPVNSKHEMTNWKNPAAAAALRVNVDLLGSITGGIERNFDNLNAVRAFMGDMQATADVFGTAEKSLVEDDFKENDAFLPLISRASTSVVDSIARLNNRNIAQTWPAERNDILSALRASRAISDRVAQQLDPSL